MSTRSWQFRLGVVLVLLSAVMYSAHYVFFRDSHHIFIYMLGDLAFVPIEVLLVTVIVHRLLSQRESRARLSKLNMVIGAFFTEVGTDLIALLSDADPDLESIRASLVVKPDWKDEDYRAAVAELRTQDFRVDIASLNLSELRSLLSANREFLVNLLTSPTLLEHESFTKVMQATFHLTEELAARETLSSLPDTDLMHLGGDVQRAYSAIVSEWLNYLRCLQDNYPYLFSLAVRTNPFDRTASPVVR